MFNNFRKIYLRLNFLIGIVKEYVMVKQKNTQILKKRKNRHRFIDYLEFKNEPGVYNNN